MVNSAVHGCHPTICVCTCPPKNISDANSPSPTISRAVVLDKITELEEKNRRLHLEMSFCSRDDFVKLHYAWDAKRDLLESLRDFINNN